MSEEHDKARLIGIMADFERKKAVYDPRIDDKEADCIEFENQVIEDMIQLTRFDKIPLKFEIGGHMFSLTVPMSKLVSIFNGIFNDKGTEIPTWSQPNTFKEKTREIYAQIKGMLGNVDGLIDIQNKIGLEHMFMKAGPDGNKLCTYLKTADAKEFLETCDK